MFDYVKEDLQGGEPPPLRQVRTASVWQERAKLILAGGLPEVIEGQ